MKLTVASGAGIAAISRFALEQELQAGTLAVLDVARWRLPRTVAVVTARDVPLTPPAERFLETLRDAFHPGRQPTPREPAEADARGSRLARELSRASGS